MCPRGHSFDVARSGYVNLLQPQDRRSKSPGDAKYALEARVRLVAAGVGRTIREALVARAATIGSWRQPTVAELGSGAGDTLAAIAAKRHIAGIGIDLSVAAVDLAARRFPALTWVVANADRRLPLVDRHIDLVLSMHARRNPPECARVLAPEGFLLVMVPAPDDLIELRTFVQGDHAARAPRSPVTDEHAPFFELVERSTLRERQALSRDHLLDLLQGTYRGARSRLAARVEALAGMEVTLASDMYVFRPKL